MKKLYIGLPKGRFQEKSLEIIKNHFPTKILNKKTTKKLIYECENLVFFLLKPSDICSLIFDKKIDIGIVPDEWILEYETQNNCIFEKIKKIKWISTRISLISSFFQNITPADKIVSSYPYITKKYLEKKRLDINIENLFYKLNGSIEATIPNLFSFGVDCIESGETLRCNGLIEVDIIHDNLALSLISKKNRLFDKEFLDNLIKILNVT